MSLRAGLIVCVIWVLSLAGVVAVAQQHPEAPIPPRPGTVISGTNLGFRVDSDENGVVVGTLVVRMNGQWVPVEHADRPRVKRLGTTR